ncbi:hypothetical protein D0865_13219 [Hortaea werneckii]|uniref:Mitotic-spindle organizing protein 1 n=1 Tax=Hortaea werneckii TaxID=91943 RepID=A0A3M7BDS9_HORWE|nr:hypothetical protein D0865_13219 [Hortaea werneckii]
MPAVDDSKRKAARETIDILHEISTLLNTHLDRQSLSYCVSLIENGVNPGALAKVIKDLRAQNERYELVLGNAAQEANASYGKLKHCDPLEAEAMLNYEYNWPIEA